jgi:hypothetical protein
MSGSPEDHDYLADLDDEDDEGFNEMSCGLQANGHCSEIGTEWCDWCCPFSGEARHNRRHLKPKPLPLFENDSEGKS